MNKVTENCNIKRIDGSSWKETILWKMNVIRRCIIVSGIQKNYSSHQKIFDLKIYCKTFLLHLKFIDIN